jgi:peroxiredoxin Q/BCP
MDVIGKIAPDVELPASNGEKVRLSDFKGKNIVPEIFIALKTQLNPTTNNCNFMKFLQK